MRRDDGRWLVNLFSFVKQIFRVNPRLVIAMFTFSYVWFSKVSVVFHWPQWILFVYFWDGEGEGGTTEVNRCLYNTLSAQVFSPATSVLPCLRACHTLPFPLQLLLPFPIWVFPCIWFSACTLRLNTADCAFLLFPNINPSMCLERATCPGIFSIKVFTQSLN